jgi:hypothetical protein
MRLDDAAGARQATDEVKALSLAPGLSPQDRDAVARALREVDEL